MGKTVFRPGEAKVVDEKVMLPLYKNYSPVVEEPEVEEEIYSGPTADDLRREAEAFKASWETEKNQMIAQAHAQADEILKNAENAAFAEVKRQTDSAAVIKAEAEKEAEKIIQEAKNQADAVLHDVQIQKENIESEAYQKGFEKGTAEGFEKGNAEVNRLIDRMHKVLESVMQRREEILQETESQIVELVILMARKVIKILSENQKNIVMANTLAALKKVKTRGKVILRVNIEDLKLTSAHVKEFIEHVENIEGITILEDSSVEKGGVIVETDFGAIDARISSQLTELENKILEISPLKSIKRQDSLTSEE